MSARNFVTIRVVACAVLCGLAGHACSAPPASDDRVIVSAPGSRPFALVGVMLDRRCGTLDCHGSLDRNFRLYGQEGLRLEDPDLPGAGDTTAAELDASYHSLVGLEPEILTTVVREGGARPERLTLVRKARATEDHLGGKLFAIGDDQDVCLTSWLTGTLDEEACKRAIASIDPLLDRR
jgi:hypothetical protein